MVILALKVFVTVLAGYLLGSLNTSIIVGMIYGLDIRQHGSGNAGATNTLRTLGKIPALLVTVGDILKGVIACLIGLLLIGNIEGVGKLGIMTGGLAAILGHNWPVYFGFRGGKGVFVSIVTLMMMDWKIGLITFGIFFIIVLLTRFISLGSIIGGIAFPIISAIPIFDKTPVFIVFAIAVAILVVVKHRTNITRLMKGTESKLGAKKTAA